MSVLSQLHADSEKYCGLLQTEIETCLSKDKELELVAQVGSVDERFDVGAFARLFEWRKGRTLVLVYNEGTDAASDVGQEVILHAQGFLVDCALPPIRRFQIPRNPNRIIDLKQSVTLTGLGTEGFTKIVNGLCILYHTLRGQILQRGCMLREWTPGENGGSLTLTFSNRYLTAAKDVAEDEVRPDLGDIIDPFNVLRPLLRTEVHTQDNCVEYWMRERGKERRSVFTHAQPELLNLSNMVDVQFAIHLVKVGRQEYVFVPKLRAVCLLGKQAEHDHNLASIRAITSRRPVSPLKKVKRKVGYGQDGAESKDDSCAEPPQKAMRRLSLLDRPSRGPSGTSTGSDICID